MRSLTLLLFILAQFVFAEGPEFEVASIKPFVIPEGPLRFGPRSGGPGTADPTHMTEISSPRGMLATAFDMRSSQIFGGDNATDMFQFDLVLPERASKDDVTIMWRNLLISRFGLKYHMEQREFPVDELVVGPKGHKLTENTDPEPAADQSVCLGRLRLDDKARPVDKCPGLAQILRTKEKDGPVIATMVAQAQPISALVGTLSNQLGRPVVDKTGLAGKYDFSMDFTPPGGPPRVGGAENTPTPATAVDPEIDLPTAVQQQLGLRLVKGKSMLDVVVVDKIERLPTEN